MGRAGGGRSCWAGAKGVVPFVLKFEGGTILERSTVEVEVDPSPSLFLFCLSENSCVLVLGAFRSAVVLAVPLLGGIALNEMGHDVLEGALVGLKETALMMG